MREKQSGAAFILALFATVVLTTLAVGLSQVVRAELMASRAGYDRARARCVAKAGFTVACALLMYDDEADVDSFQDAWALVGEDEPLSLGDGNCRTAVIDASSLVNMNTANLDLLTAVTGDAETAQGVIDWRTENGPFHSIGELVQVDGISREWLADKARYLTVESRERNVTARGEQRTNVNTADAARLASELGMSQQQAQRLVSRRQAQTGGRFASLGDLLSTGAVGKDWLKQNIDRISLSDREYTAGLINLNTASEDVLAVLPGATSEFVEAVLARQQQARELALTETDADQESQQQGTGAFRSAGEVMDLPGLSDEAIAGIIGLVCTKSSTFLIESDAGLDDRDLHVVLQAIVLRREGDTPVIHGWRELPRPMYSRQRDE